MQQTNKHNKAFTLIEILVVATIIGVLVMVTAVSFANSQKRSRDTKRKTDLEIMRQALVLYRQDNGSYGDVSGGFTDVVNTLFSDGYLTSDSLVDPKTDNPVYSLSCELGAATDCNKVKLTASLENETPADYEILTP
jgi:prepilin-type N-terminal cleavage/methylation domain-containing protein